MKSVSIPSIVGERAASSVVVSNFARRESWLVDEKWRGHGGEKAKDRRIVLSKDNASRRRETRVANARTRFLPRVFKLNRRRGAVARTMMVMTMVNETCRRLSLPCHLDHASSVVPQLSMTVQQHEPTANAKFARNL